MPHTLKVMVDPMVCIGAAECRRRAPGTFELDDEDVAFVKDPQASDEEVLREAERACPSGAISVDET